MSSSLVNSHIILLLWGLLVSEIIGPWVSSGCHNNTSIKNHVTTSISYIHSYNSPVIKTCHHTVNVSTTEAELFTIRCGINQAVGISYINHIIVITDLLHAIKRIFDLLSYPYQIHFVAIFRKLWKFFRKNINNCIKFWDSLVDKNTKSFELSPSFPYESSWDFCKKHNCNSILS